MLIKFRSAPIGESKVRRPLRRRDPLSASASVGNSVVRNRLVRPAKKSSTTTTEPADRADDVEEATRAPARLVRPSTSKSKSTTPKSVVTTTPKSAFVRPSRRPSNRKPSFAAASPAAASSGNFSRPANFGSSDKKYKIVCYFTNWAQYRPKTGKYLPEDIDPFLCTHIIYAFGWLKKGKLSSLEANDESVDGKVGLYERMMALKGANPELKVLLALGGWTFGTAKFKEMSATRYSRQTFVFSAIPFMRQHGFDGLDLDWEYPKGADDKRNFVSLLKGNCPPRYTIPLGHQLTDAIFRAFSIHGHVTELREAFEAESQEFKRPRLLLSAAVPVGPDNINGGYDVPAVASYLDFINLMVISRSALKEPSRRIGT